MRTATILKYLAYGTVVLGISIASKFFVFSKVEFWVTIFVSLISWFILRLFANIAQIVYDIKAELIRTLGNIERALYRSHSITQEIRDLIESDKK